MNILNDLERLAENVPGTVPLRPNQEILQDRYRPVWRPFEDITRSCQPNDWLRMAQERFQGALSVLAALDEFLRGSI